MLEGILNFLTFIEENWTIIITIITLCVGIYNKANSYFKKSHEEQLEIAKAQIKETMLKWVTLAECDYESWVSAGAVKRSQVIDELFAKYPILSKVTNQAELIAWIDDAIDEALKTMRKIIEENKKTEVNIA